MVLATVIDINGTQAGGERGRGAERATPPVECRVGAIRLHRPRTISRKPLRMVANFTSCCRIANRDQLDERAHNYIDMRWKEPSGCRTWSATCLLTRASPRWKKGAEAVDSGAVVAAVIERLSATIVESGNRIHVASIAGCRKRRTGTRARLIQNLISNAVKFRSDRAPRIEHRGGTGRRYVEIFSGG